MTPKPHSMSASEERDELARLLNEAIDREKHLEEQLEAQERERDEETQAFLTRTTELKEQLEAAVSALTPDLWGSCR